MGDKSKGLFQKYYIERMDGTSAPGEKHNGCDYFVLDLTHDPLAYNALVAYANDAEAEGYHALAYDLRECVSPGYDLHKSNTTNTLTPESIGLKATDPKVTYLDDYEFVTRCWIGSKWDIAEDSQGGFQVYRKGNYVVTTQSLETACAIARDGF